MHFSLSSACPWQPQSRCPRLAGFVRLQPAGRTFGRSSPARVCAHLLDAPCVRALARPVRLAQRASAKPHRTVPPSDDQALQAQLAEAALLRLAPLAHLVAGRWGRGKKGLEVGPRAAELQHIRFQTACSGQGVPMPRSTLRLPVSRAAHLIKVLSKRRAVNCTSWWEGARSVWKTVAPNRPHAGSR